MTWLSLNAYDEDELVMQGAKNTIVGLTAEKLTAALTELKQVLVEKGEAYQKNSYSQT